MTGERFLTDTNSFNPRDEGQSKLILALWSGRLPNLVRVKAYGIPISPIYYYYAGK